MKRKELKKSFEEIVKDIKVSNKLKEKTLNKIYSKNNVYHFPSIIKNCAAVFVVTCLCLSIYLVNNKNIFNEKNMSKDMALDDATSQTNESMPLTNSSLYGSEYRALKSAPTQEYNANQNFYATNELKTESASIKGNFNLLMDSIEETIIKNYIGLNEEEFLINNPNAKKKDDGYIIIENDQEVFYKLKDGIISEKIVK